MSIKLIVNADDYGHTAGVSAGIREAHLQGIVTSTSVMMNRPSAPRALIDAARLCPRLGIGLHLVLTSGRPLSNPNTIPSLVTEEGLFRKEEPFIAHLPQLDLREVWAEWKAQVVKFIDLTGHAPDHLDSHHHSSYFTPALFRMMLDLASEFNCAIRRPNWPDADSKELPAPFAPDSLREMQGMLAAAQPRTTEGFCGDFYGEGATREALLEILARIARGEAGQSVEIMCHPALVDDELRVASSYNDNRGVERACLEDPAVREFVFSHGIELVNFGDLEEF
jgi:predicted glycoside hydrolase/deacetylase ChbG (UPF0249 family)